MILLRQHLLNCFSILLSCVGHSWSEVCSSVVEDISVHQCNPNQSSSPNLLESPNAVSPQACKHFVDNVSFDVINTEHGIVLYHVVLPPAACGYTRYIFKMIVSNATLCVHIDDISWGRTLKPLASIHSGYADEFGVKNIQVVSHENASGACANELDLTFKYVSTQCYQLVVQPFISSDSQIQLYSNWHSIVTNYKPIHPQLFVPQFDWRHDENENLVTVRLIVHTNLTIQPIASCVEIMSGIENTGQHACFESGSPLSQCLVWFGNTKKSHSSLHKCDKDRDSERPGISRCASEVENELVCWIENVTAGNYCVVMKFLDERCQGSEAACSWHKTFVVNNKTVLPPYYSSLFPLSSSPSSNFSSAFLILLSILMLTVVSVLVVVKTCHRKSLSINRYKYFELPISRTPSAVLEERNVLLLFARDCDVVMDVIKDFKSLLQRTGKCKVFDFWDVDQFNSVARNPLAWLNQHMSDEKTIVIIMNTPVAQLLLQNQIKIQEHQKHIEAPNNECVDKTTHIDTNHVTRAAPEIQVNVKYKETKCFDNLFTAALGYISQLSTYHSTPSRVFIVSFDADVQSLCSTFLFPMTLTRFILPQHVENLLYHIHSLSPLSKQFALNCSEDYLKLTQSIDLMLNVCRTQPQYLLDLLVNVT